jgi:hypothetical protein
VQSPTELLAAKNQPSLMNCTLAVKRHLMLILFVLVGAALAANRGDKSTIVDELYIGGQSAFVVELFVPNGVISCEHSTLLITG